MLAEPPSEEAAVSDIAVLVAGLGVNLVFLTLVWLGSLRYADASLVDRVWGLLFLLQAIAWAVLGDGFVGRQVLLVSMVAIWALRLSAYITWRNWGDEEDKRYQAMRAKDPDRFPVTSLFRVFWLQGVLAWVVGHTLFFPLVRPGDQLIWLDGFAAVVWAVGLYFEAVGDWQLTRFLADPDNRGKVMDQGLWRYTRHPNYFGDTVVWAGFALVCVASGAWWGVYGAIAMWVLIVRVSGVAMTEKVMTTGDKREGYDEYVQRTNAFFPGPRKPAAD